MKSYTFQQEMEVHIVHVCTLKYIRRIIGKLKQILFVYYIIYVFVYWQKYELGVKLKLINKQQEQHWEISLMTWSIVQWCYALYFNIA